MHSNIKYIYLQVTFFDYIINELDTNSRNTFAGKIFDWILPMHTLCNVSRSLYNTLKRISIINQPYIY